MVGTTIPITTTQVKAKWASKLSLTKESIGFGNGGGASGPCNSGGVRQDWGMVGGRGWGAGGFWGGGKGEGLFFRGGDRELSLCGGDTTLSLRGGEHDLPQGGGDDRELPRGGGGDRDLPL
ncbi:hypothetical protein Drorol1_Dr00000467, partial [Drosera rotundifolia]